MQLYWAAASPYARKVRIVAREKALAEEIEEITVDVYADSAILLAANPLGKIPALVLDDGLPLYDSPVICAFLDAHPRGQGAQLCPSSGPERWQVLRAQALGDGAMDLALGLTLERRKPEGEHSPTTAGRWRTQLARAVDAMMPELMALPGEMTLGHITIVCALDYIDFRHPDFGWREGRADLAGWHYDITGRPSLAATAPK